MKQNKAGIDIRFAKSGEYRETLEKIIETEKCPFCRDNFKYHKKPILKEHMGWILTENSWPYKDTQKHLVFISIEHKEELADLTIDDFTAVKYLAEWATEEFNIKGGGLTMRFGDQSYTGATVKHLHFHLIYPELDEDTGKAKVVNFPIG